MGSKRTFGWGGTESAQPCRQDLTKSEANKSTVSTQQSQTLEDGYDERPPVPREKRIHIFGTDISGGLGGIWDSKSESGSRVMAALASVPELSSIFDHQRP